MNRWDLASGFAALVLGLGSVVVFGLFVREVRGLWRDLVAGDDRDDGAR